jgi:hypothetical protein
LRSGRSFPFSSRTAQRYLLVFKHRDDPRLKEDPVEFLEELRGRALPEPTGEPVSKLNLATDLAKNDTSVVFEPSPSAQSVSKTETPQAVRENDASEPLSDTELQKLSEAEAIIKPLTNAPKRQTKQQCWDDACVRAQDAIQELIDMQDEWRGIYENMNEVLQNTAYGQKLNEIAESLDLQSALDTIEEAANADLPKGFARD